VGTGSMAKSRRNAIYLNSIKLYGNGEAVTFNEFKSLLRSVLDESSPRCNARRVANDALDAPDGRERSERLTSAKCRELCTRRVHAFRAKCLERQDAEQARDKRGVGL